MKFLLGIAVVLLATSATVNADIGDSIENYFDDLGGFFKQKGTEWAQDWKTGLSGAIGKLSDATKTKLEEIFNGTKGDAIMKKLKDFFDTADDQRKAKLEELKKDEEMAEVLALLQKANGGPAPLALSGLLATAMMSLFILF